MPEWPPRGPYGEPLFPPPSPTPIEWPWGPGDHDNVNSQYAPSVDTIETFINKLKDFFRNRPDREDSHLLTGEQYSKAKLFRDDEWRKDLAELFKKTRTMPGDPSTEALKKCAKKVSQWLTDAFQPFIDTLRTELAREETRLAVAGPFEGGKHVDRIAELKKLLDLLVKHLDKVRGKAARVEAGIPAAGR